MKTFLDVGAALLAIAVIYSITSWFITTPDVSAAFQGFPGGLVAIPMCFFVLYTLWHMISRRHWHWFVASLVLAPFTSIGYYFVWVRKELTHAAQQGAPGDRPRPAGSAGA